MLRLFEVTLRVRRIGVTHLHPRFGGAQIIAYSISPSEEVALSQARNQLISEGHDVVDEPPRIRELSPDDWDKYVTDFWPGLREHLPSQQEVISSMANQRLFFGSLYPFE